MKFPNARFKTREEFLCWYRVQEEKYRVDDDYFHENRNASGWFCTDTLVLHRLKNGKDHNDEGPAIIFCDLDDEFEVQAYVLWCINGNQIEEFNNLWLEDLSSAQLKKLEFYKLKYMEQ